MPIINQAFYDSIDKAIDAAPTKEDLQQLVDSVFEQLTTKIEAMTEKIYNPLIAKVEPYVTMINLIMEILSPPSIDPSAIVQWITKAIEAFKGIINAQLATLQPYIQQYNSLIEMINGFPAEIEQLQQHINNKMAEKGWDITIPDLPPLPNLPPLPPIPEGV